MKHERELLKLPPPPCPEIALTNERQDRFSAELFTIGGIEHLGVTVGRAPHSTVIRCFKKSLITIATCICQVRCTAIVPIGNTCFGTVKR